MRPLGRTCGLLSLWLAAMLALAGIAGITGIATASSDGAPSNGADFHARAPAGAPVALRPTTTIEVSSNAPADYTARIAISVGGRVLARGIRHGHSDTSWSLLRVPLSARQRHAISSAARRRHRRPILGVQLKGTLAGKAAPSAHYLSLVMSVPGLRDAAGLADSGASQLTRISLAGLSVDGAAQHVVGRIVIRTPRATFERVNKDASPSAQFMVKLAGGCQASVLVSKLATATATGARTQALRSLAAADTLLGAGKTRTGGVWGLGEIAGVDPHSGEQKGMPRLYGLAVTPIAARRWMYVRAFVDYGGTCTVAQRRASAFVSALQRLLSSARVEARILPNVR